ncbi:MAG TPA: hypothetical protein P5121_24830, partial [Caldilineaceae bacterium]|nr:hypothetical protein [Caldilineaceae bacterium]
MKYCYLTLVTVLLLGVTACGRDRAVPTMSPATPTPAPATATPPTVVQSISLIDQDLLQSSGTVLECDSAEGVAFTCTTEDEHPHLAVTIDGGSYARWRLRVPAVTTALTGDETLLLQLRRTGSVAPNLYLVEQGGRRIWVSLARYGLIEGEHQLAIPLRELRDEEGQWLDFAAIDEVQIVFEWAEMAGALDLLHLEFASTWAETVTISADAEALAAALTVPD